MEAHKPTSMRSLVQKGGMPADQALRLIRRVLDRSATEMSRNSDRVSPDHFTPDGTIIPDLEAANPIYLAPEQRSGGLESGERAAVYSIGACLFELLTGEVPDERPFGSDVISIVRDAVVANGAAGFGVNDLAVTVSHLLNPDPFERYESLYDVDRALEHISSFSEAKPEPSGGADKPLTPVADLIRGFDLMDPSAPAGVSGQASGSEQRVIAPRDKPPDSKSGIRWNTPDFDASSKSQLTSPSDPKRSARTSRSRADSSQRLELKLRTPQRSLRERLGWKGVQLRGDKQDDQATDRAKDVLHPDGQQKTSRNARTEVSAYELETSIRKRAAMRASDRYASGRGLLSGASSAQADEATPFVWDVLIVNFLLTLSIAFFVTALLWQCLEALPIRQIMTSGLSQEALLISDRAALMTILVALLSLPVMILMAAASSAWRALLSWAQQAVVMLLAFALLFQINLSRLAAAAGIQDLDPLAHMAAARAALANLVEAAAFSPRLSTFAASSRFAVPVFVEEHSLSLILELSNLLLIVFLLLTTVLIVARQQRFGVARALRAYLPLLGLLLFEMIICFVVTSLKVPILSDQFGLLPIGLGLEPSICAVGFACANLIFGWIVIARHARLRLKADSASWLSSLSRAKSSISGGAT